MPCVDKNIKETGACRGIFQCVADVFCECPAAICQSPAAGKLQTIRGRDDYNTSATIKRCADVVRCVSSLPFALSAGTRVQRRSHVLAFRKRMLRPKLHRQLLITLASRAIEFDKTRAHLDFVVQ